MVSSYPADDPAEQKTGDHCAGDRYERPLAGDFAQATIGLLEFGLQSLDALAELLDLVPLVPVRNGARLTLFVLHVSDLPSDGRRSGCPATIRPTPRRSATAADAGRDVHRSRMAVLRRV